jgi:DNA-binding transcriptional ArsR family regulator
MYMDLVQRSRAGVQIIDDVETTALIADILKAVAHPLRLRIVTLLCQGDWQVNALADRLGALPAIVSQQLRILRLHRLVTAAPAAGYVTYRLREPRLRDLVNCMEHCSLP